MEKVINDLANLFDEAKQKSEFNFVLVLINHRGMGTHKLMTNLYEWFDAIEFYKRLYSTLIGKEKTRIGVLLYSTFFENNDFYNIIGSLCRIKLGYRGSSYLFWKTKKYERLLGIGEKQEFLLELLSDAEKENIISFFSDTHFKEIRNTFFHSAYSLSEEDYLLHDTEPIYIDGIGTLGFNVESFLYPKIDNVIIFFEAFKRFYLQSFDSYKTDKQVVGHFPNPVYATILGSSTGLRGFKVKNAVQFYGKWHDSGIWYEEKYDMWTGHNISMQFTEVETIEIDESLTRYEGKSDINKSDTEFHNLVEKVKDRKDQSEIRRATHLLVKFGNIRYQKMIEEENFFKTRSFPKIILPYYQRAVEIGSHLFNMTELKERIKELEASPQ